MSYMPSFDRKTRAHLLSLLVLPVVGVVSNSGQKLQEAVECVAVACWEQVDQQLSDSLLLVRITEH